MESVYRYSSEMMEHLPERDDDTLFNNHKLTVERVMKNVDKEAIREAFMDIIDLNWMKCEEVCRETLGLVETRIISAESQGYWSLMKTLYEEYNACIGASLYSKMKFILLEHLNRRQDADFKILMKEREIELGANATIQSRAAAPASSEGDVNNDTYEISGDLLRTHKALLKDRLQDTEFGILDKLLANGGLTHQETTAIHNCSTDPYVRNDMLIEEVLKKDIVPRFINALLDTDQKHLVNYLKGDGAYKEDFGEVWPLTDELIKIFDVNQGNLIDTIDPSHSGLIDRLFAAKVMNPRQYAFISEEPGTARKNTALLNILRRRSVKDYNSTVDCLNASNQKHVAEVLKRGGVLIKLRFSQEGDPQTVNRIEDTISNQILDLLQGLTMEERQRTLELTQLKVYSAQKGESIYLYVYCATVKELRELHRLLVNGTVKSIVETLFNKLISVEDRIVVSLTYSEEEYDKCKSYFGDRFLDSTAGHEEELELRMTWGRVIIFWKYWIECRKESIDLLNKIIDTFLDKMPLYNRNTVGAILETIESQHDFENYPLLFSHTINKDFFCYKVLLRKLAEFLDLVTSNEYVGAFGVEPKDLFFNISTFQGNISVRQSDTCRGFEICENLITREQEGLGETAKLLTCTSRPLFHLKDLLRKLNDEDRLSPAGIEGVMSDLQQEETDMSTLFSESLLSFLEVSCKVNDAVEQLRKDIEEWLPKRSISVSQIKEIIDKLNKTTKDVAITQTVSSSVGIVGGAIAIGGLILAPFTLGATLIPSVIAGGVVSGLGAATAIGAAVAEIVIDKGEMEKATTCIEKDKVLFEEVAKRIENLNRNSTMLLQYVPQDELESFISVMTDPQSTAMISISSKSQVDPRIAINVARLVSIGGKAVVMPVSRLVIAGTIAASRVAVLALAHSIAAIGVALDIANLVLASVKLGKGAKSENAEKLEEVVKKMEEERDIIENCLAEMS